MYGNGGDDRGIRGRGEPIFLLPRVIVVVALVPIAIVVLRAFLSPQTDGLLVYTFGFVPDRYDAGGGATAYPGGVGALVWSFLTYALLHEGWAHVLINTAMFAAIAGPVLLRLGTARFVAFLIFSTVLSAVGHLVVAWGSAAPMIGASGTVSGLFGALVRFLFRSPRQGTAGIVEALAEPRVRGIILALVLMNVVLVFFGSGLVGGEGGAIAWGAHLGGFLAGFLGFGLFEPRRREI